MFNKSGEKGLKWWMRHVIVVIIVTLIGAGGLIACNTTPAPVLPTSAAVAQISQTPSSTPTCEPPTAQIRSNVLSEGVAGQQVALGAEASGTDLAYSWSVSAGTLADSSSAAVIYTIPPVAGKVVITLRVHSSCGSAEDDLSLNVIIPTRTPTSTPTFTPTPTRTATRTVTPKPTITPSPKPILLRLAEPKNDTCVGVDQPVDFQWQFYRPLNATEGKGGEYFALNFWSSRTDKRSVNWTKDTHYPIDLSRPVSVFTQEVDCGKEKGCYWSVDVIESNVDKGGGWLSGSFRLIASSAMRNLCVRGRINPISPTDTPEPESPPLDPTDCPFSDGCD
jgi:hypothetical protein